MSRRLFEVIESTHGHDIQVSLDDERFTVEIEVNCRGHYLYTYMSEADLKAIIDVLGY